MALSSKAQEVLLRATQLIGDNTRWIKGHAFAPGPDGPMHGYCSLGAIELARIELGADRHEYRSVSDALSRTLHNRGDSQGVINYNDHDTTTHEDVKRIFCETVKREITGDADIETLQRKDQE